MQKLIAVYGTLRKGESNHRVLGDSTFITTKRIAGFKMYGAHRFPAVIKGTSTDFITIEIYRINNPKILKEIDILEGFDRQNPNSPDNFYSLQILRLEDVDEPVEIYTFDHRPEMVHDLGPQIEGGDWCRRGEGDP